MKTIITIIITIVVIAAVAFILYHLGFLSLGRGSGDGDVVGASPVASAEDTEEIDASEEQEEQEEPVSLIIEIREDKIYYSGTSISLDELDELLANYEGADWIWTLHDYYRADHLTFESVRALLIERNIVFREE